MTTNPADLYERTRDALGQLRELRRTVADLSREYAALDPDDLTVDALGETLTVGAALVGTQDGLVGVDRGLGAVDDAFDVPLQYGSRIGRQSEQ